MPPKSSYRGRRGGGNFNGQWRPPDPPQQTPPTTDAPESTFSQGAEWDTSPTRASAWEALTPRNRSHNTHNWNSRAPMAHRSQSWSSNATHQQSSASASAATPGPPPSSNLSYSSVAAHPPQQHPATSQPAASSMARLTSLRANAPTFQSTASRDWQPPSQYQSEPYGQTSDLPIEPLRHSSRPAPPVGSSSRDPAPAAAAQDSHQTQSKKKKNKKSKKARKRRQSFAAASDTTDISNALVETSNLPPVPEGQSSSAFYRLGNQDMDSDTSMDSEALLDHREQNQNPVRARRSSVHNNAAPSTQLRSSQMQTRSFQQSPHSYHRNTGRGSQQPAYTSAISDDSDEDDDNPNRSMSRTGTEQTPLLSKRPSTRSKTNTSTYGISNQSQGTNAPQSAQRRKPSGSSSASSWRKANTKPASVRSAHEDYDVNNPPSRPVSPRPEPDLEYDEPSPPDLPEPTNIRRAHTTGHTRDTIIDMERGTDLDHGQYSPQSPASPYMGQPKRRATEPSPMEDVCIPFEQMTEIGEEDDSLQQPDGTGKSRRRKRIWPDLAALEEWSQEEKEEFTQEGVRAKKVDEPVLVGGRLRPQKGAWRREVEDAPFRWTYFNEEMDTSLRSHTISGLQQLGMNFRELFIPDRPEIEEDSSDEEDQVVGHTVVSDEAPSNTNDHSSRAGIRQPSLLDTVASDARGSSGDNTPSKAGPENGSKPKRYGPRPVFWLDVLQPTWEEMRVLSRAFGIHKLTAEDIMEQEAREKVELFRTYYFVNYRTFEQDDKSEDYMDPVNMYFVVFKGGVISFHFSQLPHPPNVRRRIRQLAEHQYTDSDWIAYAIIDNITDAYAPLIEQIETEVDDIDDAILQLNSPNRGGGEQKRSKPLAKSLKDAVFEKGNDQGPSPDADRDMLMRVGECRKRVMGLYRLLGSKADVIKGLAKRCNEQWEVAPRSDVGLYLGDIQDHIVTMTANLTHYENILSRAHSNYLAQINIGMNERAEQTADVLGKLTVVGTIVLPMNVITGMWGANVKVPGQDIDNLNWFAGITVGLVIFGVVAFFVARKFYKVV